MPGVDKICVIGGGIWGSVMADILASRVGGEVKIWEFVKENAFFMDKKRRHPNFRELRINPKIKITALLGDAANGSDLFVVAIPAKHIAGVSKKLGKFINGEKTFVSLAKGIDQKSLLTPCEILEENIPGLKNKSLCLSGPSFAVEVARKIPTKLILAGKKGKHMRKALAAFNRFPFHIETCGDRKGVELSGALKNVYAVGGGIIQGLKSSGSNTRAAYLTSSLAEMRAVVRRAGGMARTVYSHASAGDLILTATSELSRNFRFGLEMAKSRSPAKALEKVKTTSEGYFSILSAGRLCEKLGIKAPIIEALRTIVYGNAAPETLLDYMGFRLR